VHSETHHIHLAREHKPGPIIVGIRKNTKASALKEEHDRQGAPSRIGRRIDVHEETVLVRVRRLQLGWKVRRGSLQAHRAVGVCLHDAVSYRRRVLWRCEAKVPEGRCGVSNSKPLSDSVGQCNSVVRGIIQVYTRIDRCNARGMVTGGQRQCEGKGSLHGR
jgi:hypothetical protein